MNTSSEAVTLKETISHFFWFGFILLLSWIAAYNVVYSEERIASNLQAVAEQAKIAADEKAKAERIWVFCTEQILLMPDDKKRIKLAKACRKRFVVDKSPFVVDKSPYEIFRDDCENIGLVNDDELRISLARKCRKDDFSIPKTLYELQYEANEKQDQQVRQNQTMIENQQKQINALQQELNKKPVNN